MGGTEMKIGDRVRVDGKTGKISEILESLITVILDDGITMENPANMQVLPPYIDVWANFLMNEKLVPDARNTLTLLELCQALAKDGGPCIRSHKDKIKSRQKVVCAAFDLGIDLTSIKKDDGRIMMGRGLLDVWNSEYEKRFESKTGTAGDKEATRRDVKTRLAARTQRQDV
jgi:hypothetical protein